MFRSFRSQDWLLMMCVLVLALRAGTAHLHLCFDGREPPVSQHLFDDGAHHAGQAGMSAPHHDADVPLGDLIGKSDRTFSDSQLLLLAAMVCWALFSPAKGFFPRSLSQAVVQPFLFLRPPLRGPPQFISQ